MGDPGMSMTRNDGLGWCGAVPAPGSRREETRVMSVDGTTAGSTESELTVAGAAISDGAYTLFVADFSDTDTAWSAYQELKSLEDGATVEIDGVIVVKRGADG